MKTKNKAAQELAKLSHSNPPSPARKAAARENGKKGGRPAFEWLVITTGRSLNTYTVWAKKKTKAAAIRLVAAMGRNAMEGDTLVINIADRAKYGV